jgi:hypothetical protein
MQLGSNEYLANAPRKEWEELEPEEHAKLLARQGQGYVTTDLVRVVDVVVVRKYAGTEVKLDGGEHLSLTSRPKHYVAEHQETDGRCSDRGDDFGHILSYHHRKGRVDQQLGRCPEQDVVHPNVKKCLSTEPYHLLARIGAPGLSPEGPNRIPEVAVSICQDQCQRIVECEPDRISSRPVP